jgi:hypothetical protein
MELRNWIEDWSDGTKGEGQFCSMSMALFKGAALPCRCNYEIAE